MNSRTDTVGNPGKSECTQILWTLVSHIQGQFGTNSELGHLFIIHVFLCQNMLVLKMLSDHYCKIGFLFTPSVICSKTNFEILSSLREARAPTGRPRGARAFHELRRYHTRPLRLNWGPENVHFGKTHFWDLNINVRIYQVQLFFF